MTTAPTASDVADGVDLSGQIVVITGSSGGLGLETARVLAHAGAHVVLAARAGQKLDDAAATLRGQGATIDVVTMDLADLRSVETAAAAIATLHPRIDTLILNAGVMMPPYGLTADGFELQFGTNHLGHFHLTRCLLDGLLAAPSPRVVVLSSAGHRMGDIRWDDPNFENGDYSKLVGYGQSKTANALFAVGLDERYGDRGLLAVSVHPGVIHTDLGRHMTSDDLGEMMAQAPAEGFKFLSIAQGAATTVWAATSSDLVGHGGAYLEKCGVAAIVDDDGPGDGVRRWAQDRVSAERLWEMSVHLVDQATDRRNGPSNG